MNTNEISEVVDYTPTWQALLIPMLDLYAQQKVGKRYLNNNQLSDLMHEFKSMANAADKWNEHVKTTK